MDLSIVWTAVGSVAGVAAVVVAGWQVRIGIADHRLRQEAHRNHESATSTTGGQQLSPPGQQPVRLHPRAEGLADREGLLASLHNLLETGPEPRRVALCGLGGTGKTTIAVEYAHRHLAQVQVCWQFSADDPVLFEAEFAVLAGQLGVRNMADVQDPVASVHSVLARQESPWLLIFDNAPDLTAVARFFPPTGPGRVIITTQSQNWPSRQVLEVPALGTEAAARFLTGRTGSGDQTAAAELADEMGGLPLALSQAASYMQATGMSMRAYLSLFRDRQADLLARGEATGHPEHVAATLGLALSRLGDEVPVALGLIRLLALLAPEPVSLELLLRQTTAEDVPTTTEIPGELVPLLRDPVAAGDAVASLRRYSLITPAEDGAILVHRLVGAVVRAALEAEDARHWQTAAAVLVNAAIPENTEAPEAWPACALLLPHARATLGLTSTGMSRLAEYLKFSGSHHASLALWRQIISAYKEDPAYGPEHPGTLHAIGSLFWLTGWTLSPEQARDQCAELLPIMERVLGAEHPDALVARSNLALSIAWTGEFGRARDLYADLLPVMERALGAEHPDTLWAQLNLAVSTGLSSDYASARDQCAELLPIMERVLGPEHPDTLWAQVDLAILTGGAGDPGSAHRLCAQLLPVTERALGPEHHVCLRTRSNLALLTAVLGEADGARDQLADLVPLYERLYGPGNHVTLIARDNLAVLSGITGQPDTARDQGSALLPAVERALGAGHPDTVIVRNNLAAWSNENNRALRQFRVMYFPTIHAQMIT